MIGWQGLPIGRDELSPLTEEYPRGFHFAGTLDTVTIDLDDNEFESRYETID